ncbi:MAG: hypothetical protein EZS28_020287 [Streblomastix strix]|uniref:NrS-1 polymerase-like helicase domain-containing protein n=1 Tax=Streblomastix strix TaxID=222440 RepID=A0A5J4VNK7_9EUKA|nr:MAG: hypothetical protein EZS28_020287 [Streblomastix strix]
MGLNGLQHLGDQSKEAAYSTTYEAKKQQKIEIVVKSIEKNEIDLIDPFTLIDVSSKALNGKYQKKLKLQADGKKHITGIDALEQQHSLFEKLGIKFINDNQEIFSAFQRFKYTHLDEVDQTKIEQFLALVKDTISANDERVYEYILNQIAIIAQNVGKKIEIAIILKGLLSVGKNVFTNVLSELLVGCSSKNITDIDDFVCKFNTAIENKVLAIVNEMMNFGESRMSNMDVLKSIITQDSFVINEKHVPKHEIGYSDRHYVVCECNPVHRGDLKYFTNLCNDILVCFIQQICQ